MSITLLDGLVIFIVLLSAILAMMRGFLREVLSIGSWIIAALAAYWLYPTLLPIAQQSISEEILAKALVVGGAFLITLIIVSYITMRISDFVNDSRIGPLDRSLGFIFGGARGLLLVVVAMLFFNYFVPRNQPVWVADAKSKPLLSTLGEELLTMLPDAPSERILRRLRSGEDQETSTNEAPNAAPQNGEGYSEGQQQELNQLLNATGQQ